jgi:hypothetical protein
MKLIPFLRREVLKGFCPSWKPFMDGGPVIDSYLR